MNALANRPYQRHSTRLRWLLGIAALPIALSLVTLGMLGYREWSARQAVFEEIARLRSAGQPVDDESMAVWFQAHTSPEGTEAWRKILRLVSTDWAWDAAGDLPILGTVSLPVELVPGGDWPEEARVAEFLAETKPVIELIQQAVTYPTPVWQPLHFEGLQTLLPELQFSSSVMRLLRIEVEHAGYQRQPDRALKALTSMQGVAKAFDWKLCMVSELVSQAHRHVQQATIRRTLGADVWRAEDIAELMNQVSEPIDVAEHWRHTMSGERGMCLPLFSRSPTQLAGSLTDGNVAEAWLLLAPSAQLNYLKFASAAEQFPISNVVGLARRASAVQAKRVPESSTGFFAIGGSQFTRAVAPALGSYAAAFEKAELDRRLTLTALGVKRFQLEHGRWPKQLSELEQVGLVPSDWTALDAGEFGFQVDGKLARVWGYERLTDTDISPKPPAIHNSDDAEKYSYLATIR